MSTFLGILIFVVVIVFAVKQMTSNKSSKTLPWNDGTGIGGGAKSDDNQNKI